MFGMASGKGPGLDDNLACRSTYSRVHFDPLYGQIRDRIAPISRFKCIYPFSYPVIQSFCRSGSGRLSKFALDSGVLLSVHMHDYDVLLCLHDMPYNVLIHAHRLAFIIKLLDATKAAYTG